MATLARTDKKVVRVLMCLASPRTHHQQQSLVELTTEYNQKYPPPLGLFKTRPDEIKRIVDFLIAEGFACGEVYSIISRLELDKPTKFYSVLPAGINFLSRRR